MVIGVLLAYLGSADNGRKLSYKTYVNVYFNIGGPNFQNFQNFQIVDRKRGIEGPERAPAGIRVPVHAAMGREPV